MDNVLNIECSFTAGEAFNILMASIPPPTFCVSYSVEVKPPLNILQYDELQELKNRNKIIDFYVRHKDGADEVTITVEADHEAFEIQL